jgi:putative endopeptidase
MIKHIFLFSTIAAVALLCACNNSNNTTAGTNTAKMQFIETANMDSSVKPGDNFYLFVNGKWIQHARIPSTQTSAGAGIELYNRTRDNLKVLLEDAAKSNAARGTNEQLVGDFYASGMDSATIEKRGYDPIKPFLQKAAALTDARSIMQLESDIHKDGFAYIIGMGVGADEKNSSMNIVGLVQMGLGLPDRDYYLKTDASTIAIQHAYKSYMQKMFTMLGDDSVTAAKKVAAVYALEKNMAQSHRTNVELRDPESNYNKMAVADLDKIQPNIGWTVFFDSLGAKVDSVDVGQPTYYTKLNDFLKSTPIATWKAYYQFHIADNAAPYLSTDFVNTRFQYTKVLSGQQELKPRWERMYGVTDQELGEALGHLYVDKYFTADAKNRMQGLINNLQKSFENRMHGLDWMSDSTKQVAIDKMHAFLKKVGFPDKWRDYSKVNVNRSTFFENVISANQNNYAYEMSKVGKPVDRTEWGMTPPTINAYYNPTFNEIVFPAGILQFPFFDPNADDAINYGGIGMAIGHEMTHAFDDEGSQYDKEGNLKNWWNATDKQKFQAKAKQVINMYNGFTILDTVHVNGALTTGENMADIGGLAIAYDAFKMTKEGQDTNKIDGFTPDQRFFISFAQIWRSKIKDESARLRINTDPHSPPMYRVNGPLMNFTPFYTAFNVQPGDKMYKPEDQRIKIW